LLCLQCANSDAGKIAKLRTVIPDTPSCIVVESFHKPQPNWQWLSLVQCPDCGELRTLSRATLLSVPHTYCQPCLGKRQRIPLPDSPDCIVLDPLSKYKGHTSMAKVQCPTCAKAFLKTRHDVRRTKHTYCLKCHRSLHSGPAHHCYKDGSSYRHYGREWPMLSANIRERDNHRCQYPGCSIIETGTSGAIPVHHIVPFEKSQDNSPQNLICLCPSHHAWADHALQESIPMFDNMIMMMYGPDY
jgi:5-methylcytosine-specific restriction endonuclease McrA